MAQTNVLFREIHKNAWLKRLPTCEKKVGSHPKKGERVWTVFCVHNDKDPLLELYNDQKEAGAHKPDAVVKLSTMLHVSPTLCATEDEFEFVVTLPSEVVRFTAPTWDQMMEWVDSIGCKLREMRILSPKENVYSRMPEQRPLLLPTRDPNSPLPLPPAGPSTFVPGVQPVLASDSTVNAETTATSSNSLSADRTEVSNGPQEAVSSRTNSAHYARASQRLCSPSSVSSQISSPVSGRRASSRPPVSLPSPSSSPSPSLSPSSILIPTTSSLHNNPNNSNSSNISNVSTSSDSNRHNSSNNINSNNVTVIEVSSSNSQPSNSTVFDFSFVNESLSISNENEEFFTPPGTPVVPRSVARFCNSKSNVIKQNQAATSQASSIVTVSYSELTNSTPTSSISSPNLLSTDTVVTNPPISVCSLVGSASPTPTPSISVQPSSAQLESTVTPVVTEDELADNNVYEHLFLSMNQSSPLMPNHHPAGLSEDLATPIIANPIIQNIHGPVSRGRGNPRSRRRGSHPEVSSPVAADRIRVVPSHRLQPAPRPLRQATSADSKLTLREQQVIQLRREILHPGGVRLQLRRKDCLGPIALVDAFGAVWIAGWKQKEHPMLYNVLHIGDQIISVTGVQIHSAADALKVIRGVQSLYIEVVIRRVPCGRIYAIRREREGQSLGIVQENGTAEIREIVPCSLAAMQGLTSRTPTMDGLSLTSWVLTEINGRPLNLFFKDNEVRDRLNAVGLDISILVQPFDLIKQIKKQLKTLRSYKDFIVQ